ncbi:MAG: DUF3472 domain-containing protein [Bacteroidetes bacterium]|nr:DUF3472 domain-containing protein [Bacteroidota bacterium]
MTHTLILIIIVFSTTLSQTSGTTELIVPVGGNAFITSTVPGGSEEIAEGGVKNWTSKDAQFSVYVKLRKTGTLKVTAMMMVPDGKNAIQCTINNISAVSIVRGPELTEYPFGTWSIAETGYVRMDLRGMKKSGKYFAEITELRLSGSAVDSNAAFVRNNEGNYFYWGRRGPSVHINYDPAEADYNAEWFYSEITVPIGNDVIGSFYMANGFKEGYFGIQVNSESERRVLFSVWSPFQTDDPSTVPEEKRIILKKKGDGVQTGEFGNEGSGGQSFLVYPWRTGTTYGFLLRAEPGNDDHTVFTAYFFAPEMNRWQLIASFRRPATRTYLTRLHSFLENFEPSTGYISRKACYGNQWIRNSGGEWKPLTTMIFTADATAQKGYRLDYKGGTCGSAFYLKNCGFFNDPTTLRSQFSRKAEAAHPMLDLSRLE